MILQIVASDRMGPADRKSRCPTSSGYVGSRPVPRQARPGALFQFPVGQESDGSEDTDRLSVILPRQWRLTAPWIRPASVAASPVRVTYVVSSLTIPRKCDIREPQ